MQLIQATQEHGILRLMLDDNARRNALSMDMLGQLQAALDQVRRRSGGSSNRACGNRTSI